MTLRGIAAFVVGFVNWLAVLIQGEVPESMHDFVAAYLRYATQVSAYVFLAANPYPWFRSQSDYPVDLEIDPPVRQGRWGGFFRLFLALPALLLADHARRRLRDRLAEPGLVGRLERERARPFAWTVSSVGGAASAAAFLAWFAIVARGRAPRGLRDLVAFALGYGAQAGGYLLPAHAALPDVGPGSRRAVLAAAGAPGACGRHGRPRAAAAHRPLPPLPRDPPPRLDPLWSIAVFFVVFVAWFAALVTGRVPVSLHRFLAAYVRYATHLGAFVYLVGRRFPGFTGRAGSYGIDVEIDPPTKPEPLEDPVPLLPRDSRRSSFRGALGGVVLVIAFLGWWYALVKARMPEGMRNLGVACLRYSAQTYAYALLVTERYPYAAPVLREAEPEPEEIAEPSRRRLSETPSEDRPSPCSASRSSRSARSSSIRRPSPTISRSATLDVDEVFGADLVERAKRYERFFYVDWVLAADRASRDALDLREARRGVRARVVGRADRHRDAPRDARPRDRVARPPPVRRSPLTGGSDGGTRAT